MVPNFFVRGLLKNEFYTNKPKTFEELKNNNQEDIQNISPKNKQKLMENVIKRVQVGGTTKGLILFS